MVKTHVLHRPHGESQSLLPGRAYETDHLHVSEVDLVAQHEHIHQLPYIPVQRDNATLNSEGE